MPHPETAVEAILGSADGLGIIRSLVVSAGEWQRTGRISGTRPGSAAPPPPATPASTAIVAGGAA